MQKGNEPRDYVRAALRNRDVACWDELAAGRAGPTTTIVATAPPAPAAATATTADRLLDLALKLVFIFLVARLGIRRTAIGELLLGKLDVRGRVLERRGCALRIVVIVERVGTFDLIVRDLSVVAHIIGRIGPEIDGLELRSAVVALGFGHPVVTLGVVGGSVVETVRRGRDPLTRIDGRPRLTRPPLSRASSFASHGALRSAQRVSRCGVWHLHQRQYLRSCNRSGLFRLLLLVW